MRNVRAGPSPESDAPAGSITLCGECYPHFLEKLPSGAAFCRVLYEDGRPVDLVYLYTNPAFARQTGLNVTAGTRLRTLIPDVAERDPVILQTCARIADGGDAESFDLHVSALNAWFSVQVWCPRREHVVAMFTAITERKALESALARTSAQLQEAQRIAHVGNWERDLKTDALTWSDEMYRIDGLPLQPGTVTKNNCSSTIHPEDRPATAQAFEAAIQFGATLDLTHRVVMPTGEIRTVQVRGEVLVDSEGCPLRVTGTAQDVTVQVRQAGSLRRKEQHLRSVFAAMSEGLVVHARDGHVIDANPAAETILGLSRDELLGGTSIDPRWHAIREDGEPFPGEEHPAMVTLRSGETVRNQVMGVLAPDTGLRWRWNLAIGG